MKKSISILLALLICFAVCLTGCNNTQQGGVVDNSDVAEPEDIAQSDIKIQEGETTVEENLGKGVDLFIAGKYYLEGTIYSDGEAMPVTMSTDGTDVQLIANISGISFGILVLGDSTYAMLPKTKQYTELNDTLIQALGIGDAINISEFQDIRDEETDTNASITQYAVTINGDAGLCTIYTYEDTIVKLYSIGDQLIQVENFDENGNITMQIVVDSITDQIPADQLTLKGLEQASVTSFIKSFMGSVV